MSAEDHADDRGDLTLLQELEELANPDAPDLNFVSDGGRGDDPKGILYNSETGGEDQWIEADEDAFVARADYV